MAERIPTLWKSSTVDNSGALVASYSYPTPAKVFSVVVKLDETAPAAGWVQLFDTAGVPINPGAKPFFPSVPLQPGQIESIELGQHGVDVSGLYVGLSSTHPTLTLGGAYLEVTLVLMG